MFELVKPEKDFEPISGWYGEWVYITPAVSRQDAKIYLDLALKVFCDKAKCSFKIKDQEWVYRPKENVLQDILTGFPHTQEETLGIKLLIEFEKQPDNF